MILRKVKRKFRFYPTPAQERALSQVFGCTRLVYNQSLAWRKESYEAGEKPSYCKNSAWLTALKKTGDFAFLNEVSCVPLQQSLRHLQGAYTNFFKGRSRFPKFKSRKAHQSCEFTQRAFTFRDGNLSLAKIGRLKVRWSMPINSAPTTVTAIKTASGKYFVTLTLEEYHEPLPQCEEHVGIDLGIETFATLSTGEKIEQPKSIRKLRRKLARAQKSHSRKKKGSRNRDKARRKVALVHEKIANIRTDFLNKLSTRLVNDNQVIAIEDLVVSAMMKNRKLARLIGEQGWREFRTMLEYKCEWKGRELRTCDRFFASSKTCSSCGEKSSLTLDQRKWKCPCGAIHDRDVNASINILAAGQAVSARRADVRPIYRRSALKQEPVCA